MAASIRTCILLKCSKNCRFFAARSYARRWKRTTQDIYTPDEEIDSMNRRQISDPSRNPLVPFIPGDPVQKTMRQAAEKRQTRSNAAFNNSRDMTQNVTDKLRDEFVQFHDTERSQDFMNPPMPMAKTNEIKFERLAENDKRFGRLIMQARGKSKRQENKEIVLEGKNLIVDALKAGVKMKVLYFAGSDVLEDFPASLIEDADVYKVRYNDLKLWSDVVTPQGLLGIFELPNTEVPLQPTTNPVPFTLICDSIRDAGNMGTLIRTAAAVGCQKVIATKGCVDIWNGKVLRSAVGGHFRVPIVSNVKWSQIPGLLPSLESINVLIADNNKSEITPTSLSAVDRIEQLKDKFEGSGGELSENTDNDENDDDDDGDYYNDNDRMEKESDIKSVDLVEDDSFTNFELLNAYKEAPLKLDMYDNIDYTERYPVLVISGETTGISLPARKLAYDHFGRLVNIPMVDGIDSLNCTIAASVIMYEISRQYRQQHNNDDDEQ